MTTMAAQVQRNGAAELIEQVQYLYLRSIFEPTDNAVRILVEEASGSDRQTAAHGAASQWLPIAPTKSSRTFELYWKHYVAYLVTDECAGSCGRYEDEQYTGKILRSYTRSHFLDHLVRDTGGHSSDLRHYKLICLNHLIDVASEEPPEIAVLKAAGQ